MIRVAYCPCCQTELLADHADDDPCPGCRKALFYHDTNGSRGWLPRECGPYQLVELVAEGTGGLVWKARHRDSSTPVAVTVQEPMTEQDAGLSRRLDDEFRQLSGLNHVNLVCPVDHGQEGQLLWQAMPWVDGPSLADLLADARRRNRPVSIPDTRRLLVQVCEALEHLHRHGIVHRHLKPGSALITFDGTVKVVVGVTPHPPDREYAPPELAGAGPATPASDVYSLGVIWYEMLTGDLPGGSARVADALQAGYPPAWSDLISRCLKGDPEARPRLDAILAALRTTTPALPSAGANRETPEPIAIPPWLPGAIGGLVMGTIVGAGVALYMNGGYLVCCLIGAAIGASIGALIRGNQ